MGVLLSKMGRIEYDCDGKGNFSIAYYNDGSGIPVGTQMNLSFYGVYAFSESRRINGQVINFVRLDGLAKRLADQEFREKITKINGSSVNNK